MFGNVVLEIPRCFEHEFDAVKASRRMRLDTDLDEAALRDVRGEVPRVVKKRAGRDFPKIPSEQ